MNNKHIKDTSCILMICMYVILNFLNESFFSILLSFVLENFNYAFEVFLSFKMYIRFSKKSGPNS